MATKFFETKKSGHQKSKSKWSLKKVMIGVVSTTLIAGGSYGGYKYFEHQTDSRHTTAPIANRSSPATTESRMPVSQAPMKFQNDISRNLASNDFNQRSETKKSNFKKITKKHSKHNKNRLSANKHKKHKGKKLAKHSKNGKYKKLASHKRKKGHSNKHLAKAQKHKKMKKTTASKKHKKAAKKSVDTASR